MFFLRVFLFIFLPISILSQDTIPFRKIVTQDYLYKPYSEEGYFQGWNYFFYNKDYHIFITSLISNLGPGDSNHGIALSIKSIKTGDYFITKEFSEKSLKASRLSYNIQNYNNSFEFNDSKYDIKVYADDIKLHLVFKNFSQGFTLSGERHFIKENKFVRADVPFYNAEVEGYLDYKGEVIYLKGRGGMEHLLTNYEVYKYSSRWEILRGYTKDLYFYTGGFYGTSSDKNDMFKTFIILDAKNTILLSGKIKREENKKLQKDPYSGYTIPAKTILYLNEEGTCTAEISVKENLGSINVLANISALLRFFVKIFFANPYIIANSTTISLNCPQVLSNPSQLDGILNTYLINPK